MGVGYHEVGCCCARGVLEWSVKGWDDCGWWWVRLGDCEKILNGEDDVNFTC